MPIRRRGFVYSGHDDSVIRRPVDLFEHKMPVDTRSTDASRSPSCVCVLWQLYRTNPPQTTNDITNIELRHELFGRKRAEIFVNGQLQCSCVCPTLVGTLAGQEKVALEFRIRNVACEVHISGAGLGLFAGAGSMHFSYLLVVNERPVQAYESQKGEEQHREEQVQPKLEIPPPRPPMSIKCASSSTPPVARANTNTSAISKLDSCHFRILCVGLDGAGKTTLLRSMPLKDPTALQEDGVGGTIGVNVVAIELSRSHRYEIWEVGGTLVGQSQRVLINKFVSKGVDGLIFVLDGADHHRMGEACEGLHMLLNDDACDDGCANSSSTSSTSTSTSTSSGSTSTSTSTSVHASLPSLKHTPLLALVTKQDVENCLKPQDAAPWLALGGEQEVREVRVGGSTGVTLATGLTNSSSFAAGGVDADGTNAAEGTSADTGADLGAGGASRSGTGAGEGVAWLLDVIADTRRAEHAQGTPVS
jgi:hypothetical protein